MSAHSDPASPAEWQIAVDAAHALLMIDAARQYGFIEGGPSINAERCDEILEQGRFMGYSPDESAVERLLSELAA